MSFITSLFGDLKVNNQSEQEDSLGGLEDTLAHMSVKDKETAYTTSKAMSSQTSGGMRLFWNAVADAVTPFKSTFVESKMNENQLFSKPFKPTFKSKSKPKRKPKSKPRFK